MLQLFRNSYFFNILLLLPYALILRANSFISPVFYQLNDHDSIIFKWVFRSTESQPWVQSLISVLLIFFTAGILNQTVKIARLANPPNLFAGSFYILISSISGDFMALHPMQAANLCLAISLFFVIRVYKKHAAFGDIFNIGFFIGLAVMIYLPYLALVPAVVTGIFIMRSFRFKERLVFIMALFCSAYLLLSNLYWQNDLQSFWPIYFTKNINFHFAIEHLNNPKVFSTLILFALLIIYAASRSFFLSSKKSVVARKAVQVFFWLLLFTIPGILLANPRDISFLQFLAIPLAMIIGLSIGQWRNKTLAELIHFVLLLVLILFQYSDQILSLLP